MDIILTWFFSLYFSDTGVSGRGTLYVSGDGSDTTTCGSDTKPCQTLVWVLPGQERSPDLDRGTPLTGLRYFPQDRVPTLGLGTSQNWGTPPPQDWDTTPGQVVPQTVYLLWSRRMTLLLGQTFTKCPRSNPCCCFGWLAQVITNPLIHAGNKAVLLRELNRHTARRVASSVVLTGGGGGTPSQVLAAGDTPSLGGVPPPPSRPGQGTPHLDLARVPPHPDLARVPPIWTWPGYPPIQTWPGYPPNPDLAGVRKIWTWLGYPPPHPDLARVHPHLDLARVPPHLDLAGVTPLSGPGWVPSPHLDQAGVPSPPPLLTDRHL